MATREELETMGILTEETTSTDEVKKYKEGIIQEEKLVDSYTNAKVIALLFPLIGFLGAIIHVENRPLSNLFTKYSVYGILLVVVLIVVIIAMAGM